MKEVWSRLETFLERVSPELHEDLRPGLAETMWQDFETKLGVTLPSSLKNFYAFHDGQEATKAGGLFFGMTFLPFAEVVKQWEGWHEIIGNHTPEWLREQYCYNCQSITPDAIKATYANNLWIPFAHDWGGNHLGIDLDPDLKGTPGQVINFGRDEDYKVVVAESFEAFVEWFMVQLESGNYAVDQTTKPWLLFGGKPETHFLDTVKTLFSVR